jgi:hypothetical protein
MYIIISLALIVCILLIYLIRRKQTKERFAFYALTTLVGFAGANIIPFLKGHSFLSSIEASIGHIIGLDVHTTSNLYDKSLSVIIFLGLLWLAMRIHANWDGSVTERQFQNDRQGIKPTIVQDAFAEGAAIIKREPIKLHEPVEDNLWDNMFTAMQYDWKQKAANLLMAYSSQYKIDVSRDWYSEYSCFVSKFGVNRIPVIVHCPNSLPTEEEIEKIRQLSENLEETTSIYTLVVPETIEKPPELTTFGFTQTHFYTEKILLDSLSELPSYREFIRQSFEEKNLTSNSDLKFTLADIYVTSSGLSEHHSAIPSVEEYIWEWLASDVSGHLAILGDYGQGKSTLSLKLAYDALKKGETERIPIIIELRGKSPRTLEMDEILYSWCKLFGVEPNCLLALHASGRLLLIFEGFDEMDFVGDAEVRLAHFRSLWKFAGYDKAKILVTGRPNFFFDTNERRRALPPEYCTTIRLLPFNLSQVGKAIRAFPIETKESLLSVIDQAAESSQLRDLLSRPSTLFWAATIWDNLRSALNTEYIAPASVIGEFVAQAYDRQKNKRLETFILSIEREYFSLGIAIAMHQEYPGVNQISAQRLRSVVASLIEKVPDALRDFTTAGEQPLGLFKERISDQNRRLDTVLTDVRNCGILIEDLSRSSHFKFAHKAFYEYLISVYISYSLLLDIEKSFIHETFNNDKPVIMVQALRNSGVLPRLPSVQNRYDEIAQFAGQIFATTLIQSNSDRMRLSVPHLIFKHLFPGFRGPLTRVSLSRCKPHYNNSGNSNVCRFLVSYSRF